MVSRKSGLSTLTPRRSDVALSVNSLSRRAPATPSAALAAPCAVAFCVSVASLATTIRSISSKVGPLCVGSAPSSASPSASPPSNHFSTCTLADSWTGEARNPPSEYPPSSTP